MSNDLDTHRQRKLNVTGYILITVAAAGAAFLVAYLVDYWGGFTGWPLLAGIAGGIAALAMSRFLYWSGRGIS